MAGVSNLAFDKDIRTFMSGSLSSIIDGIQIDHVDLVHDKSEFFTQSFLKDSKGAKVTNEPVHNIMHRFIRFAKSKGYNRYLILGCFGHGKTEQISTGYALHQIAKNPNILIKLVHLSDTEAIKRCRAIRDYIQKDDDVHLIAPHVQPTNIWGSQRFIVKRTAMSKDGTVEAYGILSTSIGGRANLIIFDDPQDFRTAVSEPTTRQNIEDTFKNIWLTRLIPGNSEAIVLMNKWHERDLAAFIQANPIWSWMSIAISKDLDYLIYNDSFGRIFHFPLWTQFNKHELINKRTELGDRDFDRGYRLIPYSDKDRTFSSFKSCCRFGIRPEKLIENESNWIFIGGIDFSSTKRPGTVLSILAVHKITGMKIPLIIDPLRGSQELPEKMVKYFIQFGVDLYMAENNGVQDALIDMLQATLGTEKFKKYGIKIEAFQTGRNKADPLTGLPSIEKEMANGEWMFCLDAEPKLGEMDMNNPWTRLYLEFSNHPFEATSDIIMSLWFCREGSKQFLRKDAGPHIF